MFGATPESTRYVTTSWATDPFVSVPIVHVNGSAPATGSVPGPLNPVATNPAGRSSTTVTDCASDGPLFVTVIVYVKPEPPAVTGSGSSVFVIARRALVVTIVSAEAYHGLSGSLGLVTFAVLTYCCVALVGAASAGTV